MLIFMTDNSNSANIESEQKTYHFDNLRNVLISTGLEILVEKDSDEFSLREVARTVGVSATSVYRHFTDKQAFVEALCNEGSQMLAAELRKAMSLMGGGQEGFDASGLAYVHFAVSNPALFRLMNRRLPTQINYGDLESPVNVVVFSDSHHYSS
jgi:AcrR family transcriptional regulator